MKSLFSFALSGLVACSLALGADVGKEAPAFTATTATGEKVSLSDYKDKVVVLEWVNFGCPFVKKFYSGKDMQKLQADYTAKDVVWLSVHSSAEGKQGYFAPADLAAKSESEGSLATAVLSDADGTIGKLYDAKVTPHMMIIGKDGTLLYSGAMDSIKSTNAADIEKADKLFVNALDAVIAGDEVAKAKNKPYGCGVKY